MTGCCIPLNGDAVSGRRNRPPILIVRLVQQTGMTSQGHLSILPGRRSCSGTGALGGTVRSTMERRTFQLLVEDSPRRASRDRRTPGDRRKCCERTYFLRGGKERRSWGDRRFRWDMTR